jgi:hypothetical protein
MIIGWEGQEGREGREGRERRRERLRGGPPYEASRQRRSTPSTPPEGRL